MPDFPLRNAFIALPLEGAAKASFLDLQKRLQPFDDVFRFQNPDTPHLTLYFWKELLKIEYDDVIPKLERIVARTMNFDIETTGVDTFGKPGDERVLFLSIAFSPELATLKKLCPWPNSPDQPFHPHITIARIGHPQKFAAMRKKIMKACEDSSFVLHADRLRFYADIDGHAQTPLEDFPFGG